MYGNPALGGQVTGYFNATTEIAGAMEQNGRTVPELSSSFKWRGEVVTAGAQSFGSMAGLQGIGLSIHNENQPTSYGFFAGSTGLGFMLPFFTGYEPQHLGMAAYVRHQYTRWQLAGFGAFSGGQHSMLSTVAYTSTHSAFKFNSVGGSLVNIPYVYTTAVYKPWSTVQCFGSQQDTFGLHSGHSDNGGISGTASFLTGSSSVFYGESGGLGTLGESFTLGAHYDKTLFYNTSYFETSNQHMLMTVVKETHRRFSVSETLTRVRGTNTLDFGGGYKSNRFSVSLDHQVVFVPFGGKGFEQITSITLTMRIPHTDAELAIGNYVSSTGQVKYTVSAQEWANGPIAAETVHHTTSAVQGKYVVRGMVQDKNGISVEGIAVHIGKQLAYSDRTGAVFIRTKKNFAVGISVDMDASVAPGNWRVVKAPTAATPRLEGSAPEIFVIEMEIF